MKTTGWETQKVNDQERSGILVHDGNVTNSETKKHCTKQNKKKRKGSRETKDQENMLRLYVKQ